MSPVHNSYHQSTTLRWPGIDLHMISFCMSVKELYQTELLYTYFGEFVMKYNNLIVPTWYYSVWHLYWSAVFVWLYP
jgi:hypothetical protein